MELKVILLSLRREKGLSQAELAEELGVSRQAVSRWEAGLAVPSGENLIALSRVYGVTVEELYRNGRGEEPEAPPESKNRDAPEIDRIKSNPHLRYKWFITIIFVACIYLGTLLWGQIINSRMIAIGYLIWETIFLAIGWIIKILWRKKQK